MSRFFILVFVLVSNAWANESLGTSTFADVLKKAQELRTRYEASEILIALDLDNTLLRAKQNLGSDQWVEWQTEAISGRTPEALFESFEEMLQFQANLYQLSTMRPTEENLPATVQSLQKWGHPTFILTSRSVFLRSSTERELKNNQFWFEASSPMPGVAVDILEPPFKRPVSFLNGIFMTSGHHKGEALDYFIKRSGKHFKAVLFVDDIERHTKRVYDTFSARPELEIITYRYSRTDSWVQEFKNAPKAGIIAQALELKQLIAKLFQ